MPGPAQPVSTAIAPKSASDITMTVAVMKWMQRWPFRPIAARKWFTAADSIELPDYSARSEPSSSGLSDPPRMASEAARICGVTSITWPSTPLTNPGESSVDRLLGQLDGLVDGDRFGNVVGVQQLPHRHPQHRPVDGGQPFQRPALQMRRDEVVDVRGVLGHAARHRHRVRVQRATRRIRSRAKAFRAVGDLGGGDARAPPPRTAGRRRACGPDAGPGRSRSAFARSAGQAFTRPR